MQDLSPVLALAVIFALVWGLKYLQVRKRREEREMVHRERMLAIEKGIPLPEIPPVEENGTAALAHYRKDLLPRVSLGCGILLLFLGIGVTAALRVSPMREAHEAWTMGFIPLMLGVGFLIYYVMLRVTRS